MAENKDNRRLAAVLIADIAGYTRLVEQDTDGTVAAWKAARAGVIEPQIAKHSGRIVKLTGDGFLAEFPVVQDAVLCAVAMQQGLATSSLDFRMGVNLGDIVDDGQDIHGEGVNIAARIEALADEGGICISGSVFDQVRNRLDDNFEDMGAHDVKHVSAPVQVYRVVPDASVTDEATTLTPPDKPSIAVLPFDNMSGEEEQEYFSDGITEDIITALSQVREFFVIARNTTFTYKNKAVNVSRISQELGVRYILEGSVRRAANRVRITTQLIDAETGNHLWAEKFDREMEDIFAVQDEITQRVVGTIGPELGRAEQQRALMKPPNGLDAWELFHRGAFHHFKRTLEGNAEAKKYFHNAIERDPDFVQPFVLMARSHITDWLMMGGKTSSDEAMHTAQKALQVDDRYFGGYQAMGLVQMLVGRNDDAAIQSFERALELNPNDAQSYNFLGCALASDGRADEAVSVIEQAIRLSPSDQMLSIFFSRLAGAHLCLKDYEAAIECGSKAAQTSKNIWMDMLSLPAALAYSDRVDEARLAYESIRKIRPEISAALVREFGPFKNPDYLEHLITGLQKAGMPSE